MKRAPVAWSLLAVVVLGSAVASAQGLSDIARKEEERRKALKGPSKVYTNDDLKKHPIPAESPQVPGKPAPAATTPPPVAAPGDQPPAGAAAAAAAKPAAQEEAKDEAYWKGLITAAQTKLERDESYLEALQSRVNALTNDFYARDDPAQRAVIWTQRTKALDEMERLKTEIAAGGKTIAKIQEDARREGVPPGWLR